MGAVGDVADLDGTETTRAVKHEPRQLRNALVPLRLRVSLRPTGEPVPDGVVIVRPGVKDREAVEEHREAHGDGDIPAVVRELLTAREDCVCAAGCNAGDEVDWHRLARRLCVHVKLGGGTGPGRGYLVECHAFITI